MNLEHIKLISSWIGSGSINIFGRPFAGKDTQGTILANLLNGSLLGGGDILRNSDIPQHVSDALKRGDLIPSEDYVSIVLPYLSNPDFANKPLILSSVGRWHGEETGVVTALSESDHPLRAVLHLEVDENLVKSRWKALEFHDTRGGRYDDTENVLNNRLSEYGSKTLPVINEYEKMGLLIKIDGSNSSEDVTRRIIQSLVDKANEAQYQK